MIENPLPRGLFAADPRIVGWKRFRFDYAYDGDTVWITAMLDSAKGVIGQGYVRLMGVQCAEIRTTDPEEKRQGYEAKKYTEVWFNTHLHGAIINSYAFVMYAETDDKYGRWLGHIECSQGHCVNDDLLASKHAISYLGPTGLSIEEQF